MVSFLCVLLLLLLLLCCFGAPPPPANSSPLPFCRGVQTIIEESSRLTAKVAGSPELYTEIQDVALKARLAGDGVRLIRLLVHLNQNNQSGNRSRDHNNNNNNPLSSDCGPYPQVARMLGQNPEARDAAVQLVNAIVKSEGSARFCFFFLWLAAGCSGWFSLWPPPLTTPPAHSKK